MCKHDVKRVGQNFLHLASVAVNSGGLPRLVTDKTFSRSARRHTIEKSSLQNRSHFAGDSLPVSPRRPGCFLDVKTAKETFRFWGRVRNKRFSRVYVRRKEILHKLGENVTNESCIQHWTAGNTGCIWLAARGLKLANTWAKLKRACWCASDQIQIQAREKKGMERVIASCRKFTQVWSHRVVSKKPYVEHCHKIRSTMDP